MSSEQQLAFDVRAALIPTGGRPLLLPTAAIAEIIAYQPINPSSVVPDWFQGNLAWRGRSIPVVALSDGGAALARGSHRARVAVCNTLNGNRKLFHLGLLATALPRLVRVTVDNIEPDTEAHGQGEFVLRSVRLDEQRARIPNLDALEQALLSMSSQQKG